MVPAYGFALAAGALSTLSPCVLPLVPIVIGTAAGEHRAGPVALAGGVALSFTAIGLFIAVIGFEIGLDGEAFRTVSAWLLAVIGAVLVAPALGARASAALGPVGAWADGRLRAFAPRGLGGQFVVGLLLGALWSPCTGPTLGAASALAAQGRDLGHVGATMLLFGLGAAAPLLLIGSLSREALLAWRGRLIGAGGALKKGLGVLLLVSGIAALTGTDRSLETLLVNLSPDWLTRLTTQF